MRELDSESKILLSDSKLSNRERSTRAQYERDGFVVMPKLLPSDLLNQIRERLSAIGRGEVPSFPEQDIEFEPETSGQGIALAVRKINRCADNDKIFMSAARDERILEIVESLIGPDIKLFGSQCFMKPPGGIEKPYHQDSAYFTIEPQSLITCWIALDEVTLRNGCLWVIPGSHLGPIHDHSQSWNLGGRIDMQVPDDKIDRAAEKPITMPAGSCSFHHSKLLHRSGPNQSEEQRRGLAIHYMSAQSRWTDENKKQPFYPLLRGRSHQGCV